MSALSAFKLIFWLFLVPLCTGLLPYRLLPLHKRGFSVVLLFGYLIQFALFEVIAIPCMLSIVYGSFLVCVRIYTVVALAAALLGVVIGGREFVRREKKERAVRAARNTGKEELLYWGIFLAVVIFQLYMAATHLFFDGDDAYYVVESLLAQQAGVMNTILPYTGMSTTLDVRHALSVITMWEAFIATKAGVHATATAHTVLPFVFLPLSYFVYYQIAKLLFTNRAQLVNTVNTSRSKKEPDHKLLRPVFLILVSVYIMFGNVSIYTPETFLMMRTWQGKSLVANFVLPLALWALLWIGTDLWKSGEKKREFMPYVFLFFTNMTAGICSSMGVVLLLGFAGVGVLLLALFKKRFEVLLLTLAACLPSVIYLSVYLYL